MATKPAQRSIHRHLQGISPWYESTVTNGLARMMGGFDRPSAGQIPISACPVPTLLAALDYFDDLIVGQQEQPAVGLGVAHVQQPASGSAGQEERLRAVGPRGMGPLADSRFFARTPPLRIVVVRGYPHLPVNERLTRVGIALSIAAEGIRPMG